VAGELSYNSTMSSKSVSESSDSDSTKRELEEIFMLKKSGSVSAKASMFKQLEQQHAREAKTKTTTSGNVLSVMR
jgi:hypothetical protein